MKAFALTVLFLASCSGGGKPPPPPTPSPVPTATAPPSATPQPTSSPGRTPIAHVVLIVQENRTLENLFHGYPDGKTFPGPADTVLSGLSSSGKPVPLVAQSLAAECAPRHTRNAFVTDYANGSMNGFDQANCRNGTVYAYAPANEMAIYWHLALQNGLVVHALQMNGGPSFPAHQFLIAGQAGGIAPGGVIGSSSLGFVDNNDPGSRTVSDHRGAGNSCGADSAQRVRQIALASAYPGDTSHSAYPCYDVQTIFDAVASKGLSWHYYGNKPGGYWGGPQAIRHLYNSSSYTIGGPLFFSDLAAGKLANVTYIMPNSQWSDHPGRHLRIASDGPNWVGDLVNAIGESPFWKSTTIIVTWDDWGGWYDHYKPKSSLLSGHATGTYGFRIPIIVISPYAIAGKIDAADTTQGSILSYIEATFGAPSLATADAWTSDNLMGLFNFAAPARAYAPVQTSEPPSYFKCKRCLTDTEDIDG